MLRISRALPGFFIADLSSEQIPDPYHW